MKYFFVLFLFILFFYLYMNFFINSSVKYISKKEGYFIIDKTNYFKTFSENDFKVRNCNSEKHCKTIYKKNVTEFTNAEKKHLAKLVQKTNKLLKPYSKLDKVPWKFCKIKPDIENGFPHTHNTVIFLSKYFFKRPFSDKLETLIHEKIHIFQRLYINKTDKLYKNYGFNKNNTNTKKRRANPDLDDFNYDYKGNEFYYEYNENPTNINDVSNFYSNNKEELVNKFGFENEHPHEIFAYLIAKKIISKNLNDQLIINYIS